MRFRSFPSVGAAAFAAALSAATLSTGALVGCDDDEPRSIRGAEPASAPIEEGDGDGDDHEELEPVVVDAGPEDAGQDEEPGGRAESPVPGKKVTYPYGVKNDRYAAGYHTGDDYATPTGSNAVAVRDGVVRWSNNNGGAYGTWMGIDADNGRTYVYCHLSQRLKSVGDKVKAGDLVAKTGATGNVTGPHLHFEDHPLGPFKYAAGRKPKW